MQHKTKCKTKQNATKQKSCIFVKSYQNKKQNNAKQSKGEQNKAKQNNAKQNSSWTFNSKI